MANEEKAKVLFIKIVHNPFYDPILLQILCIGFILKVFIYKYSCAWCPSMLCISSMLAVHLVHVGPVHGVHDLPYRSHKLVVFDGWEKNKK